MRWTYRNREGASRGAKEGANSESLIALRHPAVNHLEFLLPSVLVTFAVIPMIQAIEAIELGLGAGQLLAKRGDYLSKGSIPPSGRRSR